MNTDFEKYKNMFDFENSRQSQEQIGHTIDGFNDWFETSDFGEDLKLPENTRFDSDRSAAKRVSGFSGQRRIIQKSFDRNMQADYKNDLGSDGRSFGNDENKNVNIVLSKTESNSVPQYLHPSAMKNGEGENVLNNAGNNLIQMKMSNNNLKVNLV